MVCTCGRNINKLQLRIEQCRDCRRFGRDHTSRCALEGQWTICPLLVWHRALKLLALHDMAHIHRFPHRTSAIQPTAKVPSSIADFWCLLQYLQRPDLGDRIPSHG